MTDAPKDPVSLCLIELEQGDKSAVNRLLPYIYDDLRGLAKGIFRQSPGHTLQPTAIVHEAYIRLVKTKQDGGWDGRKHFFAVAAMAMRQLLSNHAEQKRAEKRGGDRQREPLFDSVAVEDGSPSIDIVALDHALTELANLDERLARIVELRFLSGLTVKETAEALEISERTVRKDWQLARRWLGLQLDAGPE